MKTASAALVSFFGSSKKALQFDLWTFVLASGTVVRWTDADVDLRQFVSRASTGTYVGSDGLLKTAAVNEARYSYDPTTLALQGLLIEAASTNLLRSSNDIRSSAEGNPVTVWGQFVDADTKTVLGNTDNPITGLNGPMYRLACALAGANSKQISQPPTVAQADNAQVLASAFVKADQAPSILLIAGRKDGSFPQFAFNAATGAIVPAATSAVSANGVTSNTLIAYGVERHAFNVWRPWVAWNVSSGASPGNVAINYRLANAAGSAFNGAINDGMWLGGTMLEPWNGTGPSSYIPTTTAAVTRSADVVNLFARGPVITRDSVTWKRGIEVDQLKAQLAGPAVLVDGQALPAFAAGGGFDGAAVVLERVYLNDAGAAVGALTWFVGNVSDVTPGRMGCEIVIKSQLTQLQQQLPRNLYQAACLNDLYDSNCGVLRSSSTFPATVTAVSSGSNPVITATFGGVLPATWVELGIAKFSTGLNAGIGRTVKAQPAAGTSVALSFARPFPFAVQVGDQFTVTAGCNKTLATCSSKFANQARFRGQPFIPVPETVT